jgi:Ca2+/Na+ antiporter
MTIPSIDPEAVGLTGLIWLLFTYGFVLYKASNFISEGSDLLLLVPSLAGFVGGTVLPLLGAVPDGAILLFSGLGDIERAQETLAVGVGALAGSTIMLLTVPWSLSVFAGRVDIANNKSMYKKKPKLSKHQGLDSTLWHTGVSISLEARNGAMVMMLTTIPYFVVQIPASLFTYNPKFTDEDIASNEQPWALGGLCICLIGFFSYLAFQVRTSRQGSDRLKRLAVMKKFVYQGQVSLSAVFQGIENLEVGREKVLRSLKSYRTLGVQSAAEVDDAGIPENVRDQLVELLLDMFKRYDVNRNNQLERWEVELILTDMHDDKISKEALDEAFNKFDTDGDGTLNFDEFIGAMYNIVVERITTGKNDGVAANALMNDSISFQRNDLNNSSKNESELVADEEDEAEELPEGLSNLTPEQQQTQIKRRAFAYLFVGTFLVVMFSDPMVDVLQEVAVKVNIPPFYVSFVLAPLASNASEVIASMYYATKKTRKTMTVSMTALEGAASMNNTFCLSILLGLIYFRGLAWSFTAETLAIVVVQFIVGLLVRKEQIMRTGTGFLILGLFPISIVLVATLEAMGLD